ncbi:fatty acyl-AMP ligase [Micromonospora sp. KC207]|uniref:fatty acyl-AMP ligase n=1 Tax=Micromonospora sp. KC207 TaxID=2530377 RepID=UPI001047B0D9|nr:fatty acyl-AMP ligase [Micromonospora sp. KC207]TDC63750.1 fatty acyl-AMP ligase [Micromonospora sp. KC207]
MSTSFVHHVRAVLERYADRRHYTFVREIATGVAEERTSFGELDEQARQVACGLAARLPVGSRVLLVYAGGTEFLAAFLGGLYAGMIPVPAPLPRDRRSMERVSRIMLDADVRLVLTAEQSAPQVVELLAENGCFDALDCLATDTAPLGDAAGWRAPDGLGPDSVAFLQYTSGSTSEPRGVVVTHGNLLANEAELAAAVGMDDAMVLVSWLPHFHDMGLMGGLLAPVFVGGDCVLMTPTHFLKRPVHWLQAMSRHRATTTFAPNFAYDLCLRRVTDEQLRELDLRALRACVNGAEPVRAQTVADFTRRVAAAGLRPDAVKPGFGLAEATLVCTMTPPGRAAVTLEVDREALGRHEIVPVAPGAGTALVGSGVPVDQVVRIVDPQTREVLDDCVVGEIWVAGASIAHGYWNRSEQTRETFHAYTSGGEGPFLRTGDLGFQRDGELYVTGRRKDVIIVNGRNIYPQDVEQVAESVHPALRGRIGAAFGVGAAPEHVVIVQEVSVPQLRGLPAQELAAQVRQAIVETFDVSFPGVVLVASGVPRTTSGKVRRRAGRDMFLAQEFAVLHQELAPQLRVLLPEPATADAPAR